MKSPKRSLTGSKSVARVTQEQADCYFWEHAYYMDNVRKDNQRADAFALGRLADRFPELKGKL